MSQLEYLHGCNKRRKRSSADQRVFRFKSFCEPGYPAEFNGPFWKNVRSLLEFGHMENNHSTNGMISWSFQLEVHRQQPDHRVFLFVIEEPIEASLYRYCKHCRYIGWGQHMICNMKYHFVVPSKETAAMASTCLTCHDNYCYDSTILAARCGGNSCSLVELEGHTLHGVFHCNGFGHLLCVNGLEMGSDLAGHQIMDFWDRICTSLRARKVSLTDVSQKKGMDLRLLHGLAYGGPWFTRWDYKFGRGSFGVTEPMYQKSIQALQNIPLCLLFHHLSSLDNYLPIIFSRYQALSEHSLITLSDLFHFMLELRSRLPKDAGPNDLFNPGILLETSCRWSPKRVEMATRVIVEALKQAEPKWVSRQEVRDAARAYIGDTGLLDFVLKSLGNHVVGKYLVRRSLNPVTKVLEYCLEDISISHDHGIMRESKSNLMVVTRVQLAKDILYLYKSTLRERKPSTGPGSTISIASRVILDSKHLIKEFDHHQSFLPRRKFGHANELIEVFCALQLKDKQLMLPYELVQVKGNMTIEELKRQVEKWFKDMYFGLNRLMVQSIVNMNVKDSDFICGVIEEGKELVLEAGVIGLGHTNGNENGNGLRMQGWHVCEFANCHNQGHGFIECACGAKEDDGERMVACDICEVWQHTRCVRISNNEEVPRIFVCDRCEQDIVLSPSLII